MRGHGMERRQDGAPQPQLPLPDEQLPPVWPQEQGGPRTVSPPARKHNPKTSMSTASPRISPQRRWEEGSACAWII